MSTTLLGNAEPLARHSILSVEDHNAHHEIIRVAAKQSASGLEEQQRQEQKDKATGEHGFPTPSDVVHLGYCHNHNLKVEKVRAGVSLTESYERIVMTPICCYYTQCFSLMIQLRRCPYSPPYG